MMKSKRNKLQLDDSGLGYLIASILILLATGFTFSFALYLAELFSGPVPDLCLKNECIEHAKEKFSGSLSVLDKTLSITIAVSTIWGIIVAVKNYIKSSYSQAISNHINNYRTFSDFIQYEVDKLDRVSPQSISSVFWYNRLFPLSRQGNLSISIQYFKKIDEINEIIKSSNTTHQSSEKPDFSYQLHQTQIIDALKGIGINLERMNRNDFFSCEEQILLLVSTVNKEFCGLNEKMVLLNRTYI